MKRLIASLIVTLLSLQTAFANGKAVQPPKPFTIDELIKIHRVAGPQISPDGRWIAYTITDTDKAANKRTSQIYLIAVDGGDARQLTSDKQSASAPRWSPDGRTLAFISARDGDEQVWTIDAESGEMKKISNVALGAADPVWSPDGRLIAFTSDVYPDCTSDDCNRRSAQAAAASNA